MSYPTTFFRVEIELENSAMQTAIEVVEAVRKSVMLSAAEPCTPMTVGERATIKDRNGNSVGYWKVVNH